MTFKVCEVSYSTGLTPNWSLICLHLHYPTFRRINPFSFIHLTQQFPMFFVSLSQNWFSLSLSPHLTNNSKQSLIPRDIQLPVISVLKSGILKILHAAFPREKNTDPRGEFTQLIQVVYYCTVQHGNNLQKISNTLKDTVHPVIKIKMPQEHVKLKKEIADMVFTLQISLTICITCLFYLLKPHCKKG